MTTLIAEIKLSAINSFKTAIREYFAPITSLIHWLHPKSTEKGGLQVGKGIQIIANNSSVNLATGAGSVAGNGNMLQNVNVNEQLVPVLQELLKAMQQPLAGATPRAQEELTVLTRELTPLVNVPVQNQGILMRILEKTKGIVEYIEAGKNISDNIDTALNLLK